MFSINSWIIDVRQSNYDFAANLVLLVFLFSAFTDGNSFRLFLECPLTKSLEDWVYSINSDILRLM